MKKYINTSNYYLSMTSAVIDASTTNGEITVAEVSRDGVTLPEKGFYWIDVDFQDADKREIFRITSRKDNVLYYDKRSGSKRHDEGAVVGLRDFSELLNSLSTNTDNFGQMEMVNGRLIVYGGNTYSTAHGYHTIDDTEIQVPEVNSLLYYNPETNAFELYTEEQKGMYWIGRIEVSGGKITALEDMRSVMIHGGGDARISILDPRDKTEGGTKVVDVFDADNIDEGLINKFVTDLDKINWNNKQEKLVDGQNIKTINNIPILVDPNNPGDNNIFIETKFGVNWSKEHTDAGVSEYALEHKPMNSDAFIVFTDSGTMLLKDTDYHYAEDTNTLSFTPALNPTEHAIIWLMELKEGESTIGDGTLHFSVNGEEVETFNANSQVDKTFNVDLPEVHDSIIMIKQGEEVIDTFTLNQANDQDISLGLKGMATKTQQEYDDMPDSKETDGNFYLIYEEE